MPLSRTLTELDEWPRHPTIDTFDRVATDSPYWSDGYWFCIGDPEGAVNLITALRFYPNTNVADGYACVSLDDGKQYNLRCSRRLRPRIDDVEVGPLWLEIVKGLRTIDFGCRDNPYGIEFDLHWEGAAPVWDETPGTTGIMDGRIVFQRSNFVQVGYVSGAIRVNAREFAVDENWVGARDHSWGLGDTGGGKKTNPYAAPPVGGGVSIDGAATFKNFGLRQWALVRFPKRSLYYSFHRSAEGAFSSFASRVVYPFESNKRPWPYKSAELESIEFVDGKRRLDRAEVAFRRHGGKIDRFGMEVVSKPLYMQGGGYWSGFDDGLGRGVYRGEEHIEGDVWDVSQPTRVCNEQRREIPQNNGAWAETFARFSNLDDPEEMGLGLLECVVSGPYPGVEED
jgi:hypothetical protein